jgi:two-component system sensor histidine kinase MprB
MGLAAGVAVAIAVIAVTLASYLGERSELLNQIDQSLTRLSVQYQSEAAHLGALHNQGGQGQAGSQAGPGSVQGLLFTAPDGGRHGGSQRFTGDCDGGLGINGPPGAAFGGATGFVQILKPDGTVCRGTGETEEIPVSSRARTIASSGSGSFFTSMTVKRHHIRVLVTTLGGIGALMLAWPLTSVDHALAGQLLLLGVIAAAGVVFAALLGLLVARTAVAPIARFTRQAERIAQSPELVEQERLTATGRDELGRLADTFNRTLDALEGAISAQRNLVADASHELRTPIAALRANLQLLRDEHLLTREDRDAIRADMIEEFDELTRLVSDVVELARGSKPTGEPGEVRLDQITEEAIERARRRAPTLTFGSELEPTLVRGDGERIARAVTNLLDNAMKWSPEGATVEVELREGVISVRDHGPGFHEEDLPFIFDRFHRARDARSKPGSGLGLAIVKQATEAHGGFAQAGNAPGGGALMRISFGPQVPLSSQFAAHAGEAPQ